MTGLKTLNARIIALPWRRVRGRVHPLLQLLDEYIAPLSTKSHIDSVIFLRIRVAMTPRDRCKVELCHGHANRRNTTRSIRTDDTRERRSRDTVAIATRKR